MERRNLIEILAGILASDSKWRGEVDSNIMLQNALEELFSDPVFQCFLEAGLIPKFKNTYLPHFRAVELILAVREAVRQMYEENADSSQLDRQLEDFQLKISDKFGPAAEINVSADEERALEEARELVRVYREDPQFSTRIDKFRLLAIPLNVEREGDGAKYQVLVLENIRPPRQAWSAAK